MTTDTLSFRWQRRMNWAVRFLVAPLVLGMSGFFTADFLMSGVYTWPRTSRVVVLTITVCVLAYEFVYKDHREAAGSSRAAARNSVLYSCVLPYAIGATILVMLALGSR